LKYGGADFLQNPRIFSHQNGPRMRALHDLSFHVQGPSLGAEEKSSLKTSKATSTILRLFTTSAAAAGASTKPDTAATIRPSASARSYMKQASCESTSSVLSAASSGGGGGQDLNESDMSVVGLPPTPLKPEERPGSKGVSSQILPLHRLSSESSLPRPAVSNRNSSGGGGGGSTTGASSVAAGPPAYKEPPKPKPVATTGNELVQLASQKPVAEVSPFSSSEVCSSLF
jgi:hypothetical protein